MDTEKYGDSAIPWLDGEFTSQSTSIPEIFEESGHVTTVVILVISALITITLLFVVAIFIDCRQQKLIDFESSRKPRRLLGVKIPGKGKRIPEDEATIVDNMQESDGAGSSSRVEIV